MQLDRLIYAFFAAFTGFFRAVWRAARQLFHELTGTLFLVFAAVGGLSAWRYWKAGAEGWRVGVAVAFGVLMAVFAFASFCSARRVK